MWLWVPSTLGFTLCSLLWPNQEWRLLGNQDLPADLSSCVLAIKIYWRAQLKQAVSWDSMPNSKRQRYLTWKRCRTLAWSSPWTWIMEWSPSTILNVMGYEAAQNGCDWCTSTSFFPRVLSSWNANTIHPLHNLRKMFLWWIACIANQQTRKHPTKPSEGLDPYWPS